MGTSALHPRIYCFGPFHLDTRTGELTRDGSKSQLHEQPLQLLIALLEQPGELVAREDLVRRLWPDGTFVDFDRGLNKAINKLREVLGDSAEEPRFIETLPRKGYRFIAPVKTGGGDKPAQPAAEEKPSPRARSNAWLAISAAAVVLALVVATNVGRVRDRIASWLRPVPEISSLAVIPLENLSHDPEQEYFADGMTDALITDLAKMGSVRVTSRASVMRYKGSKKTIREIAQDLGVDAIVEGTVMQSGNRVRITAQLIQASTDMHLWADAYERDLNAVLDLQGKVATDIARRVNILVRPLEQTRSVKPEAYGLYLKGRYAFSQYTDDGWQQAIENYNKAIASDPTFAPAYSGLADAYLVAGAYSAIPTQEALNRGKAAATQALKLDEKLASAHYAMGTAYAWYDWNWAAADKEFHRALELNPNDAMGRNWYGGYLSLLGRHDEAIDQHERARQLDPFSLIVNANLARAFYWGKRYDEAIRQAKSTLEIDPKFGVALFWLEGSLRHKGMFKEAVTLRLAVSSPERGKAIEDALKVGGFPNLLREEGERFKKGGALLEAARCLSQVGQKTEALDLLESCYQRRCSSMATVKTEPDFEVLHEEPRFQALVERLKLP